MSNLRLFSLQIIIEYQLLDHIFLFNVTFFSMTVRLQEIIFMPE